jgi:hypothetical protein
MAKLMSSLVANRSLRGPASLRVVRWVSRSVAVAGGGDDVGVVAEPVEQADGGGLVGEEASPLVEWLCEPMAMERRS